MPRERIPPAVPIITRYRPNRSNPRKYTKEDAARVVCYALEAIKGGKNITTDPSLDGSSVQRQGGRTIVSVNFEKGSPIGFFDRDLEEILARVKEKCGAGSSKPEDAAADAAAQARALEQEVGVTDYGAIGTMERAQEEIDQGNVIYSDILEFLLVVLGVLTAIDRVSKFIPFAPLRLILTPLPLVIRRIAGFQGAILARKAANDRTWGSLQRVIEIMKAA